MTNSLKNILIAGALSATTFQGSSALAQNSDISLTDTQKIALDLVQEYNTCVRDENTPARKEAIRTYQEALEKVQEEYHEDIEKWRQESQIYSNEVQRLAEKYDLYLNYELPQNAPALSENIAFADINANKKRLEDLVKKETGLTPPSSPISLIERVNALGNEPLNVFDFCSDKIEPEFEKAGIDIYFELQNILNKIINEHGPDIYENITAPDGP